MLACFMVLLCLFPVISSRYLGEICYRKSGLGELVAGLLNCLREGLVRFVFQVMREHLVDEMVLVFICRMFSL